MQMIERQPLHRQHWVRILGLVALAIVLNVGGNVFDNGSVASNVTSFWLVLPVLALIVIEVGRSVRDRRVAAR
jgi:hypothetical protein